MYDTCINHNPPMIQSEVFGRTFWLDANDNFKSAPSLVSGGADYEMRDYVSDWQDWDAVDVNELFAIHRELLSSKIDKFYSTKMQSISVLFSIGFLIENGSWKKAAGIQLANWHTISPTGSIFVYYKSMKNFNLTLTENQHEIMLQIFQYIGSAGLYEDDTMDHADYQFDELWDLVINAKGEIS